MKTSLGRFSFVASAVIVGSLVMAVISPAYGEESTPSAGSSGGSSASSRGDAQTVTQGWVPPAAPSASRPSANPTRPRFSAPSSSRGSRASRTAVRPASPARRSQVGASSSRRPNRRVRAASRPTHVSVQQGKGRVRQTAVRPVTRPQTRRPVAAQRPNLNGRSRGSAIANRAPIVAPSIPSTPQAQSQVGKPAAATTAASSTPSSSNGSRARAAHERRHQRAALANRSATPARRSSGQDRAGRIAAQCSEIESLHARRSAVSCVDRFIDRMEIRIGDIGTQIYNCRQIRINEHRDQEALVNNVVQARMEQLTQEHRQSLATAIQAERASVGSNGLNELRIKEIELRTAYQAETRAQELASLVCDPIAFIVTMNGGSTQAQQTQQQLPPF